MSAQIDLSFPHNWQAEILPARPAILPVRHLVYPREAEEVERGALEVMVRPLSQVPESGPGVTGETRGTSDCATAALPFLATCALGFRDPAVPSGLWAAPNPKELCAVSGGYAYVIDTSAPEHFAMVEFRPVLEVRAVAEIGLLLFVGHREIIAWGTDGLAWKSAKLSDEGVTIRNIEDGVLHGTGWELMTDKERPFALDLQSGFVISL